MGKRKIFSMLVIVALIFSFASSAMLYGPIITFVTGAPDQRPENWDNGTTLNVSVLDPKPRINWYDFQWSDHGTWTSYLNSMVEFNNSAKFRIVVNISSDQGWDDINYINITFWHDNGTDATPYNDTTAGSSNTGGNRNFFIQYSNVSGTGAYALKWPSRSEVAINDWHENGSHDGHNGSDGFTQCKNLSFEFTPAHQLRYAPGDTTWVTPSVHHCKPIGQPGNHSGLNNTRTWNFNISVVDSGENNSGVQMTSWANDEFGVYSYAEITSTGWPVIGGTPGENASANDNISITTRTNANWSLAVNVTNLGHKNRPVSFNNDTIYLRGAYSTAFRNFSNTEGQTNNGQSLFAPIYLVGGDNTYNDSERDMPSNTFTDLQWKCAIPSGTLAGAYTAQLYYHLRVEND